MSTRWSLFYFIFFFRIFFVCTPHMQISWGRKRRVFGWAALERMYRCTTEYSCTNNYYITIMISSRGEWQRARDIYHAENKESGNYNSVQTDVYSIMRVLFFFLLLFRILYYIRTGVIIPLIGPRCVDPSAVRSVSLSRSTHTHPPVAELNAYSGWVVLPTRLTVACENLMINCYHGYGI